jgi:HNH endonuclease
MTRTPFLDAEFHALKTSGRIAEFPALCKIYHHALPQKDIPEVEFDMDGYPLNLWVRKINQYKKTIPAKRISKRFARAKFFRSEAWRNIRAFVFDRDGRACSKCGASHDLNIDHILPRSKFRYLELDPINLRVLCWPCNKRKAASIEIDIIL